MNYASPSSGSANHLAAEMLKTMTGADALHVPYKGGALVELAQIAGVEVPRVHTLLARLQLPEQNLARGR